MRTATELVSVIPQPAHLEVREGGFRITNSTRIVAESAAVAAARHLQRVLSPHVQLAIADRAAQPQRNAILLSITRDEQRSSPEAYRLEITPDGAHLRASSAAGLFYAVQTLLQLLPPDVYGAKTAGPLLLPCATIVDQPRFAWRGVMLDVSRHLYSKQDLLRFLDCMAMHKLNVFHWHLTDDQGWRIEIRKHPRLGEISAWRKGGDGKLIRGSEGDTSSLQGRYGGYYSQQDVREIVAYAADRHITILPEIEMPGHSEAVLAAYPQLACTSGPFSVSSHTGVHKEVLCAGREETFRFLEDVLEEVIPLFPSRFVHIGGDECPKDRWKECPRCQQRIKAEGLKDEHELQSYFIQRMERFLNSRGKQLIGWDEILEGGLAPNAAVMSWRGIQGGIAAAKAGHDVVMSPTTHCYLDYYQAQTGEPEAIGGLLPLEKVYEYEPIPSELTESQGRHVLGVQGNVWTEYMQDIRYVEYMTWPRAAAIAEIGWTRPDLRDFAGFEERCRHSEARLRAAGSSFRPIPASA